MGGSEWRDGAGRVVGSGAGWKWVERAKDGGGGWKPVEIGGSGGR